MTTATSDESTESKIFSSVPMPSTAPYHLLWSHKVIQYHPTLSSQNHPNDRAFILTMQTGCRGLVAAVASEVIEKSTVVPEILHFPKSSRTSHRFDLFD